MNNCSHLVEGHYMMMYVSGGMIFFHLCTYIYLYRNTFFISISVKVATGMLFVHRNGTCKSIYIRSLISLFFSDTSSYASCHFSPHLLYNHASKTCDYKTSARCGSCKESAGFCSKASDS